MARRDQGYPIVVVANDIEVVAGGFARAMAQTFGYQHQTKRNPPAIFPVKRMTTCPTSCLKFASFIADGRIRVVDLTQTLKPSTPVIQLPPPFAPSNPFRIMEISRYDDRGPGWYWNNIACGEHTGTHFDAPAHWVTGQHYAEGYTDTVPVQRFIAPAVVIDCTKEAAADEKFLLEPAFIEAWEAKARPHSGRRLGADAYRLVEARGSVAVPQHEGRRPACAGTVGRGGEIPGHPAQRQWLGRGSGRHRCRSGVRVRAGFPRASPDARSQQVRACEPVQSRSIAADRSRSDHRRRSRSRRAPAVRCACWRWCRALS